MNMLGKLIRMKKRTGVFIVLKFSEEHSNLLKVVQISDKGQVKPDKHLACVYSEQIPEHTTVRLSELTDQQKIVIKAIRKVCIK